MTEPIRDIETAVRELGALPVPVGPEPLMPSEQRAAIAEQLGDAKPATARLVEQLAQSVRDRREHEHPTWEDLYCLNLVSWMGERMGPVLRRLLDTENRIEQRRARLVKAEADLLEMRGLLSPNGEARRIPIEVEIHERVAPAVEWLLNRVAELEARVAEYERPADEDPIRYTLTEQAGATYPPVLPWAGLLDDEDLEEFLADLTASIVGHDGAAALADIETTCGRWRVIAEAQHAHNTAPGPDAEDDVTPQVNKLRAILAGQREQAGGASC